MQTTARLTYLDNLRALAMLAGIFFHAALAYSPLVHNYFPTADQEQSLVVDVFAWFLHLFRMPLFFVIAGYFAAMLKQKYGLGGMFSNRFRRIALPFLIFWPLTFLALLYSTLYAAEHVRNLSPILKLVKQYMHVKDSGLHTPTLGHLWFLYYLILFYLFIWSTSYLKLDKLAKTICNLSPALQLSLLPLLLAPALASVSAPHPAPESFMPNFWAIGFFGAYFTFGFIVFNSEATIERLKSFAIGLLIASLILYLLFLYLLEHFPATSASQETSWMIATIEAYISAWMTIFCIVVGKTFLNRSHWLLRYIADSSYWFYIVHLPILFIVQYWLLDCDLNVAEKYLISLTSTLLFCLISYQALVRNTMIGQLLNGQRKES